MFVSFRKGYFELSNKCSLYADLVPRISKIHRRDTRKYVIFLKSRSTLYEISRERNKIFTYFFHDNKDHISGRKPLQYQLIIAILSGVKHPSPISTPKIARYENRDKRCFQSLKTSLNY